jgi:thioredoxin-dependent peroxiredoxin
MKRYISLFIVVFISLTASSQKIEDFSLKSVTDNSTFTLSKVKENFVVLHFLLKTECPYCIRLTNEYQEKASTLPGVIQVFIKPDSAQEIIKWATKIKNNTNSLPIYQDQDSKLADKLNIPSGYQFHGQIVHYPALIIVNKNGNEVFRYIGKNNTDRFSFENLKLEIEELSKK